MTTPAHGFTPIIIEPPCPRGGNPGIPGTGTSHLAIALGIRACQPGHRVALDPTFPRLRSVDWIGKSEATISSQLIMPVLHILGYGEHALHPVPEQQIYKLRDPTVSKGSQFDYEPTMYSEGLWVMEAKGTDAKVDLKTLGPVRDYAVHRRGPAIPKLGGSKVKATREGVLDSVESERSIIGMTG